MLNNLKSLDQLARILTGDNDTEFAKLVKHIIGNLKNYRGSYSEGIPKLRLIKLMLIELAELKKVIVHKLIFLNN